MWKVAIDQRSPMRSIENAIHKGLGPGHLGVITARPGLGKTACLMQVGLNELIHERGVLHVAVNQPASKVRDVYDELIHEMVRACGIESSFDLVRVAVERHRHIHGFATQAFSASQLTESLNFLRQFADFVPRIVLIDGLDSADYGPEVIEQLEAVARDREVAIWVTLVTQGGEGGLSLPEKLSEQARFITQVLHLHTEESGRVALQVLKNGDNAAAQPSMHLDPGTMLLSRD